MKSWPAPALPALPGRGLPVELHDAASGRRVVAAPGEQARMYVCGITPYDATHLGHASTYVAFDLLQRAWRDHGQSVRYVQNVTDVDDPLLERAAATGVDWQELALAQTALFTEDMTALGVIPPDVYLGAVEAVDLVVDAVEALLAAGAAYRVPGDGEHPDGDVYFDVHADATFGSVSGLPVERMREIFAERGGDPDRAGKKHPLDCLLWRVERDGEPAWDGRSLGRGRPGWHIECTTIALRHLGMGFDVQGGGADLRFPHHEMGAAEAHVLTGRTPYARVYAHTGMVGLDGEKMSKSRGNLVFVSRLRAEGVDPAAIRLAILAHHYRQDWEWTPEGLAQAQQRVALWREALSRQDGPDPLPVLQGVRAALADDLDAPAALAVVDAWAAAQVRARTERDQPDVASAPGLVARAIDALLGVRL
ncbi:MAG: cysteine--1-D-myo-inosityl 2-amino-2-deoxy-alpha-D-glucopyranoside ligase [Kineosporiaceae bacterium]